MLAGPPGPWYFRWVSTVEVRRLPRHIAIIMDGNGRWASDRGMPRPEGHKKGAIAVRNTVTNCRRLGVQALTLYAFSEQNWARPEDEVDALMVLLQDYIVSERETLLTNGIRVRAVGRTHRLTGAVEAELRKDRFAMSLSSCAILSPVPRQPADLTVTARGPSNL
jgi:undecaprenyl diphosphate synthase